MATYGRIQEFNSAKENWVEYEERLHFFFAASNVTNADKKRGIFLTVVGTSTYKLLRGLVAPEKPGDVAYKDLVAKLTKHYNPTPSLVVQRFRFHSRSRAPGESVSAFVAQLRALTEHCKFDTVLEDML